MGAEADIQAANISDNFTSTVEANVLAESRSIRDFGSVRGRLGVAFDKFLAYGTGGWGFAHFGRSLLVNGVAQMTGDADENGYVIGGGLEYALFPHLSVKGEYQYFHFSDYNPSGPVIPPNGITVSANPQNDSFHTIRFGINYKF